MLRRYISVKSFKSSISSIRGYINSMSSQGFVLTSAGNAQRECREDACLCSFSEESLKRTASCQTRTLEESQLYKPREELQWNKLSDNEKNIYFAHKTACLKGQNSYTDPETGYSVFTEEFLKKRGTCCGNGCRHCPYGHENVPAGSKKQFNSAFYV